MNLLDLGDDELIAIFQRVDHKTKLNLMLTCKRFENVIGSYLELFGKFRLAIREERLESPDRAQTLTQMRRHFGRMQIHKHDSNLDTEAYNLFLQLFTKIGSKLVELRISYSKFCFVSLVNLLNLTPNITQLEMWDVQIAPKSNSIDQMKLGNLRRIEINGLSNIEIFEKLKPNLLYEIHIANAWSEHYDNFTGNDYSCFSRILSKQGNLTLLKMNRIPIIDFPESPDWSLPNLQKLILDKVTFSTPKDLKNFAGYLKTLDNLTDLSLIVLKEKIDDRDLAVRAESLRKFVEVLTELFSLPNLTKLKFEFDHENQLDGLVKIQNPGVQELTLKGIPIEDDNKYSQFMKIFPNVRKAKLCCHFKDLLLDLMPLNTWSSLEELELDQVNDDMLPHLKNLRSLKIYFSYARHENTWYNFCRNNRQLERLEFKDDGFFFNKIAIIAENLPNLKVLILETIWPESSHPYRVNVPDPEISAIEQNVIKIIGENFAKLEYLDLSLRTIKAEDAVAELKKNLPCLKGVIKEVFSEENWVVKTVKF